MDFNEVQEFINNNSEDESVVNFVNGLQRPITRDSVEEWCKEGEGKSWLDRNCDLYSSKAIDTARKNAIEKYEKETLPIKCEEYYKSKSQEGKTPEQIQIEELQNKIKAMEEEKAQQILLETNRGKLKEANLSTDLAKYIKDDNDIEFFKGLLNTVGQQKVDEVLTTNPPMPSNGQVGVNAKLTQEELNKMTDEEYFAYMKNNKYI